MAYSEREREFTFAKNVSHLLSRYDMIRYDLRNFFFTNRIVNMWNILPNNAVHAESTNTFKSRFDKFWSNQEIIYDYRAEIQRTGSRSLIY